MQKLKSPIKLDTALDTYIVDEIIGQGGAGTVYGGLNGDQSPIAIKLLSAANSDKKKRFKNEINFLQKNTHSNIVSVIDHGVASAGKLSGAFYVMKRYQCSLRDWIKKLDSSQVLSIFSSILDGVEAAHLLNVVHRDLKPENILCGSAANDLAIADFGIANFTKELVATLVETAPTQRLANFQYAAPEQRQPGLEVGIPADIYSLGLILNELFTGSVPHGTEYLEIGRITENYSFLDKLVAQMLRQNPSDRPGSIREVKQQIQKYNSEAVSQQKLNKITKTVIKSIEIEAPLANDPPKLVSFDWQAGTLYLNLDRPVTSQWVEALYNTPNITFLSNKHPRSFQFNGDIVTVGARSDEVQAVINFFKTWLHPASIRLKQKLVEEAVQAEARQKQDMKQQRLIEEERLRVLQNVKI